MRFSTEQNSSHVTRDSCMLIFFPCSKLMERYYLFIYVLKYTKLSCNQDQFLPTLKELSPASKLVIFLLRLY